MEGKGREGREKDTHLQSAHPSDEIVHRSRAIIPHAKCQTANTRTHESASISGAVRKEREQKGKMGSPGGRDRVKAHILIPCNLNHL